MADYRRLVDAFFEQRKFPDVKGLFGGAVITKCWMNEYNYAGNVLQALELEMGKSNELFKVTLFEPKGILLTI